MRDDERFPVYDEHDSTIAQLLSHLQQLRRSVPINYELKAELKQKLLQRMKELETHQHHSLAHTRRKRRVVWWLSGGSVALTLAAAFGIWTSSTLHVTHPAVLIMPSPSAVEQVDINPDGTWIAYVSLDAKIHTKALNQDGREGNFGLPSGPGSYQSLAWANNNRQLIVVEQQGSRSRLWLVEMEQPGVPISSRLLKEENNAEIRSPAWSPGDDQVLYTKVENGVEELWVSSTISLQERKLAEGSQPSWAPDGQRIAFVKDGAVSVMDLGTNDITSLGTGMWPSWQNDERLTYTTADGKLAEVELNIQPPVTSLLTVSKLPNQKLLRANWAADKKHLLLAQQAKEQGVVFSLAR
jgi:TolB protein